MSVCPPITVLGEHPRDESNARFHPGEGVDPPLGV